MSVKSKARLNCGFLTIAYGASKYIRMGKALARSVKHYNAHIPLAVVTDSADRELHALFDIIIPFNSGFGSGVKQKLFLDYYTPFEETIFIDSDCLVYRDPEPLWEMHKRHNIGFAIKGWGYLGIDDEHYSVHNLKKYLCAFGVAKIGAFNSGLFYFNSSRQATAVFETARSICNHNNELKSFKNSNLNDEPVFAMAMELNQIECIPWDNGEAMSTVTGKIEDCWNINALKGKSSFIKNGTRVNPIVIHFHMQDQNCFIYKRDMVRLKIKHYFGAGVVANILVLPDYSCSRIRFYLSRMVQRKDKNGYLGLLPIPERTIDWLCKIKLW